MRKFPMDLLVSWEGDDENRYLATHQDGIDTVEDSAGYVGVYKLVKVSRLKVTRELVDR